MITQRTGRVGITVGLLCALCGCFDQRQVIPVNMQRPVKSHIDADQAFFAADTYLVLPIDWDTDGQKAIYLGSGSSALSSSAWSQIGSGMFAGNRLSGNLLNLVVVDLEANTQHRLFERQVALNVSSLTWKDRADLTTSRPAGRSCPDPDQGLRFESHLILTARAQDHNEDGKIDWKDPVRLYAYDLDAKKLTQLSPAGYHVRRVDAYGNELVLTLAPEDTHADDGASAAIYRCDVTGKGRMVVERIEP